ILFERQYELPEDSAKLAVELIGKDQPKELRLAALNYTKNSPNITFGMFNDVMDVLTEDPDEDVSKPAKAMLDDIYAPLFKAGKNIDETLKAFSSSFYPQ